MASPSAMAKCLRADAKLLLDGLTPDQVEQAEIIADDIHSQAWAACVEGGITAARVRAVLMLAAAAALEVEGE